MTEVTHQQKSDNLEESQEKEEPLQIIPVELLKDLLTIFQKDIPHNLCTVGMVKNVIRWNEKMSPSHQIYAPFKDLNIGSYISVFKVPGVSYQTVNFYFQELQDLKIVDALVRTKLFSWDEKTTLLYAVSERMTPLMDELISKKKNLERITFSRTELFWMEKEQARNLKVDCPPDVRLEELTVKNIDYLDDYWPPRFEGSKIYLRTLLKHNFGLGVFLPPANDPVSWAVVSESSAITMLFTLPSHRRKGYAQLVCTPIAQKLGEMDVDPHGTVNDENHASKLMFKSLGFKTGGHNLYVWLTPKNARFTQN